MTYKDLIAALQYYEIDDLEYINRCEECLKFIYNCNLLDDFNYYHDLLFVDTKNEIRKLWRYKNLEELFIIRVHPYITCLLLLSGYQYHIENMEKFKFSRHQRKLHKKRVREALTNDIFKRKYKGIRVSQMLWGAYFINCRLIEIGILQFEVFDEKTVYIHITSDYKLNINKVKSSIKKSKKYLNKYFGLENVNYYCHSWILSKQIHELVGKKTNIYQFYDLFSTIEGEDCLDDILNFVYGIRSINNYSELSENTSLQIKIKEYLLKDNSIKLGIGKLKNDGIIKNKD